MGNRICLTVFWQTSSMGALSLNNGGDTIGLFNRDNLLVDQIAYDGLAANDQSIVRPDSLSSEFVLHTSISDQLYSPGQPSNGIIPTTAAVPEPTTLLSLFLGAGLLAGRRPFDG